MTSYAYVTYAQVEACAKNHFLHYGTKSGFKSIVKDLFDQHAYIEGKAPLPDDITWSAMSDAVFFDTLTQIPVRNLFTPKELPPNIIIAETIIPNELEVYALKYIPYIMEKMHTHNLFHLLFSLLLRRYSDTICFYDHRQGIREHHVTPPI